ncbi:MAG TPA: DUF2795 domain-containing protein [Micromonosporaceae bacterium]
MTERAVQLQEYVDGLDYPVSKEDLVRRALESGVDTEILHLLQSLPAEYFASPAELSTALTET